MKFLISITALILIFSTSCKKYEDGPLVNLTSKNQRVANTWTVDRAYDNGQEVTDDFDNYELYTTIDGDAKLEADYSFGSVRFEYETNGTWSFEDSKENLSLDFENDDADNKFQILKLTEDEMHLREIGGDLEIQLETK